MNRFFSPLRLRLIAMLFCGTALYFFANIQRVAIPGAVFDRLQRIYSCQAAGTAGLGAAFMYAYALTQPLTGLVLDRFGSRRVLLCGGLLFALGEFWFAGTGSLGGAYGARILTGLGAGSIYLALVRENMRIFRKKYNLTLSVIILLGYAGGIAANAPFLLVVKRTDLPGILLGMALISLAFWGVYVLLGLPEKLQAVRKENSFSIREFLPILSKPHNRKLYGFSSVNFALYYVLQTVIGKKFLQDYCGMPELQAGWILSTTGGTAALGGLFFAVASHLAGNRRRIFCRLAGISCISVFGTIFLLVACGIRRGALFSGLFLLLSLTASLSTIVIPLLHETNPEHLIGKTVSMLNFSFYLAVAVVGTLTGTIFKFFTPLKQAGAAVYGKEVWTTIFGVLFLASCTVVYFSFQMKETYGKRRTP